MFRSPGLEALCAWMPPHLIGLADSGEKIPNGFKLRRRQRKYYLGGRMRCRNGYRTCHVTLPIDLLVEVAAYQRWRPRKKENTLPALITVALRAYFKQESKDR